uniref:BCL-6 corepressor n=1 Tax=Hydra vulgaris TaxID=6087 RepID=T2MBP4_HYDVU
MEGSPIVVDHTLSAVRQLNVITYASSSEQSVKPLSCTIINNIEPSVSIVFDSSTLKEAKKNEQINYFSDNPNLCVSEKTPGNSSVTNKSNASFSIVNSKNIFVKKNDLDLLSISRNEGCQVKLSQSAKTFNLIAFSSSADYNSKISKSSSRTSVNGKPLTFSVVSNNNDSKVSLLSNKANYSTSLNFVKNKVSTPNKFTVTSNVKKKMSTQLTSESLCLNLPPLKSTVAVTPNALSISNFSGKYSEINHSEIKSNILKNKICDGKGTTTVFSEQKKIVYGKLSVITTPNSEGGNKKKLIFLPTQSSDSNFSKQFSLNLIAKPINTQTSQFVCKAPPATQKSPIGITSTTPQNSMICKTSPAPQKLPIMVSSPLTKNLSNLNVIEDNKSHLKVEHSNNIKLSASRVSNSIERSLVNEPKDGKGVSSSSSNCGILQTFILNMPRSKFGLKFGVHCSSPTTVITTTSLNTYNAKNEKSNIYSPTVSHSNEKSNTILITKCKTQDTFKNIKKTLIVTDPLKLDQISKEKRLFKKKQDILKVKAVPTALSVSNVTSVSSVPCVSSVSNIPILKNISSIEINSQCNSIFNHNSNLLEVQTSHNITPSSSTTYLKNKVLFRKRKSNVELKDSPTSLSKISRTFFALDRLYRCKSLWINDGEKCIAYLRELRDLLVVERARQQKFLDSMMQLNIERLKKNSTQKPEKKKQTPAEKLIDKLSLKINQTPAEKLIDKLCLNIKVSETSKISKPIVKIKTFSDIQKEQEKQKHLSKYHMDQIAENEKKNNEVAVTLTDYSINSQSYVTCKRKLSDDPEVFKKFKYSKVILDSSQSTEYSNEIVASENDANMLNNQNEVSTLHVTQNQDYLLNEDENSPKQHIFISKIEKIENLSKTNVYVPEEKENIPETHSYLFKDNENELEYIALNKNEALPNLHIDSAVDKSLTSSKLELSLDIIKNENKFSNSNIVTINDDYKTSSESISKNEDNKLSLESINKNEDKKINLENITKSEDDKTNLEDLAKNEDNKSNLEGIAKNEDNKVNLDSVTRNEEKNQKLLHTLKIKSPHEIHEKLKLVKQKTSLRTRSCRPNPKDPFISKEYGALQQAIALSLKSEQGNITEAQFKDSSSFKTACKKVTKRKRCREVDQLTDAHWNESWLRGSCSPTYSNQRLGREERSLHWAMSKFAEMDNKESTKQTSKDNPIPTGKTKKTSTNENSFKRETCEKKILYNVNRSTGETILHKAARLGYCNVVEESIRSGVDVNVKDYAGWSPLHEACAYSQVGVSEILLKYGADSNSSSKNGMRPIYDALERQDFPMIRLLLSYGADISLLKSANCKSDVLKYLTAHQIDREKNCNSTMKENDEGSWKFAGTCSFLDNNECVGIFEDIPIEENLANIDFEISSRPMPLSFYLPYRNESGDILGYRNYFILSEFLNGANLTKSVLLKHSSKDVIKMTITELADLTKKYSVSKPTDDLSCDKNGFVELVYISPNKLQKILKSKVVKIPAMIL